MSAVTDAGEGEMEKSGSEHLQSVRIVVGSAEKEFVVRKDVLCSSSKFFMCALNGEWLESGNACVKLPDVDEDAFSAYVNWLVTETLGDPYSETDHCQHYSAPKKCDCFAPAFQACLLGDFLQDAHYCNAAIDRFTNITVQTDGHPSAKVIRRFWDLIPDSSGFRRLFIDLRACYCSADSFNENAQTWSQYYLLQVAGVWHALYSRDIKSINPENRERCYYHENKDKPDHCKSSKS